MRRSAFHDRKAHFKHEVHFMNPCKRIYFIARYARPSQLLFQNRIALEIHHRKGTVFVKHIGLRVVLLR